MNRGTEICRILQMFSGMSLVQNLRANLIRKGFNFARKTDMSNFLTKKKNLKLKIATITILCSCQSKL